MADEIARLKVVIDAEDNASAVVDRVSNKVGSVSGVSAQTAKGLKGVTKELDNTADKWIGAGKAINSYGKDLDTITKPLQVAAVGAIAGGVAVSKMAMDYESAFIKVKKTVNGTPEQLAKLDKEIKALSDDIPVSSTELANLAAVGGQLGIAVDDISKFTEVMAAIGTATNLQGEEGAATIARFMNVMGEETENVDRVGSAIVELGNNTATTEAEIATMAQRMGKFGKTIGMSTAQVLGYSAALSSSGIEAQLGGSAIGRTWLNIESAVNSGGSELAAYAKYAGVSAKQFAKQWSDDPSGAFNGLIKGLSSVENLTGALGELGVENIQDQQIVMALANNYELMAKSLDLSSNAYKDNTALMKEAETAYASTANQLKLALNDIQDAAISWGNVLLPEIRSGAQWVGNVAKSFENMSDAQKKTVVSGAKAAVVLGATTKVATGAIKGIGNTVEAIGNIKKATAAGGALAKFAPALASVASAAGPVALGITAVGVATVGMYAAVRKYEEYRADWSRGGEELTATIKENVDAARELSDIQQEFNDLSFKIDSGELSGVELENAQARLESIKKILKEKYNLDISVDTSQLDEAIEKAKQVKYLEVQQKMPELLKYADSKSDDFETAQSDEKRYKSNITEIQKQQKATANYRSELLLLQAAYNDGEITQEEFNDKLNELAEATGNPKFKDTPLQALLEGDAIKLWSETLARNLTDNETALANAQSNIAEYKQTMVELADAGLMEMEFGNTEEGLRHITIAVKNGKLSADEYAKQAAIIQQGQESLDAVFKQGGQVLDDYVNQYKSNMQQFGASTKETAKGAALLKNGFSDIKSAADAGALDAVSRDATQLAREMGEIPDTKSIKINAEGDISVINEAGKIEQLKNESVDVSVNADGDIEILDLATNELQILQGMDAASIQVNASGNIEVLDSAAQKIAEIDGKTGEVIFSANSSEPDNYDAEDKEATVKYDVDSTEVDDYDPPNRERTVTYTPITPQPGPAPITNNAKGTQNFGGGLAMVNDQTGISDPRELIIDNGRAFIPQGRNVILPLSKGAKVYTATQTKAIMSRLGIPQYAKGKDNSDAFTSARDDWSHTTNIRAVSVSEELEKWVEFSKKFASNVKDANDIQEKIYSLSLKQRDEMNENSEDYILTRARMNDWQAYGDTAIDAFNRVRNRERQYVAEGKVLEKDSHKYLEELGSDMFDARVKNSKWWLDHEREYNSLSTQDYMAGLNRMRAYTEEYYKNNIISAEEYYSTLQMLNDMKVDETRRANDKEYEDWKNSADGYYEQRMLYDDWDEFGDSPEQYWKRRIEKTQKFQAAEKISWEEANKAIIGYNMDLYRAQQDEFDSLLDSYDKYIDKVNDGYDELISKKREAYETRNLKQDLADAQAERDKYAGAVTQKGKDVYNQAVKDIEEIQFEMEINDIEKEQTKVVSDLKSNYETVEKDKKKILAAVKGSGINLEGYTSLIKEDGSNITNVLSQIYSVVKGLQPVYETKYGDTTVNVNANLPNIQGWFKYATNAIAG